MEVKGSGRCQLAFKGSVNAVVAAVSKAGPSGGHECISTRRHRGAWLLAYPRNCKRQGARGPLALKGRAPSRSAQAFDRLSYPSNALPAMGAVSPRPTAASRRSVRLTVLGLLLCAIWLSSSSSRRSDASSAEELAAQQVAAAAATAAGSSRRPLYGLPQPQLEAAVVAASEQHGPVAKAGSVPQQFWTDERRPWRERVFLEMLKRGGCFPCAPLGYFGCDACDSGCCRRCLESIGHAAAAVQPACTQRAPARAHLHSC